jgi:hypothetical protein
MSKRRYKAQDFIDAIPGSGGIIATIAKRVECDWTTAKIWITEKPTVAQAYADECEAVSDMAESVLLKRIQEGDDATAKWWLSRIRRGKFSERTEVTGADGGPVEVIQIYIPDNGRMGPDGE